MATRAPRFGTLDLPQPWRAVLPLLALTALALALELDPTLRTAGLLAAACFLVAAAVRGVRARRELAHIRRAVDHLIVADPRGGEVSELRQWRTHELVDSAAREKLRHELEHTIDRLDPGHLPSSSPLRRAALRPHEELLRSIADRLGDGRLVAPRGILLVRSLLRDTGSPLYTEEGDEALARMLSRVRRALDP
jgi:hypothetical protein